MKIFFVIHASKWEPYSPEAHAKRIEKFIYWKNNGDEVIITGLDLAHDKLLEAAGDLAPVSRPNGAGNVSNGKIDHWGSYKLDIETPSALWSRIEKALGLTS